MFSVCPAESEEGGSPENVALFNFRRATTDDDDRHTSMCEKGAICVGMRIKVETGLSLVVPTDPAAKGSPGSGSGWIDEIRVN